MMRTRYPLLFVLSIFSFSLKAQIGITGFNPTTNKNIKSSQVITTSFSTQMNSFVISDSAALGYGHLTGNYVRANQGTVTLESNDLTFGPSSKFLPNERVRLSVTKKITDSEGITLSNPKVVNYRVLPDTGFGQFGDSSSYITSSANAGMLFQLADMNADGTVDVVVYDSTSGNFMVHQNYGATFQSFNPYVQYSGATAMHAADLNSDGYPEILLFHPQYSSIIVFPNDDGSINYYYSTIDLPSAPQFNSADSYIPLSGDIDADGDLDLVVSCGNVIAIVTNGKFGTRYTVSSLTAAGTGSNKNASLVDIDNDGDLDIVTEGLTTYLNNGTGVFTYKTTSGINSVFSQEDVDIDNDGDVDMVQLVNATNGATVRIYTNAAGTYTLASSVTVPLGKAGADAITSGDFDDDGWMDIAFSSATNNAYVYLLNKKNGTLGTPQIHVSTVRKEGVLAADMDKDGDVDLVTLTNPTLSAAQLPASFKIHDNQLPCNPLVVTRTDDYGVDDIGKFCGTLRYAIQTANDSLGKDIIRFALPPSTTITLKSSLPNLTESVVIKGPGKDNLIIDGQGSYTLFNYVDYSQKIPPTDTVEITGMTLKGASGESGAAISVDGSNSSLIVKNVQLENNLATYSGAGLYFYGETLLLDSSVIQNNRVASNGNGAGAYINPQDGIATIKNTTFAYNYGYDSYYNMGGYGNGLYVTGTNSTIVVQGCSFVENSGGSGAGIYFSDAQSPDSLVILNSTFTGNYVNGEGAAMLLSTYYSSTYLQNVTIVGNGTDSVYTYQDGSSYYSFPSAGGISVQHGKMKMANSILTGNFSKYTADLAINEVGNFTSIGGNLFGEVQDYSASFALTKTDLSKLDPLLAPLFDNGGLTQTMVPLPGSPVINKGIALSTVTKTDQRGGTRVIGTAIDMGAVEAQTTTCTNPYYVTSTADDYSCGTLRLAVQMANVTAGNQTITFAPALKGDSIVVKSGLYITDGVSIKGISGLAISGGYASDLMGSYTRYDTSHVSISHLIFRNGMSSSPVYHQGRGNVSYVGCDFVNNTAPGGGSTMYVYNANLTLDSCRFINNTANPSDGGSGGGLYYSDSVNNTLLINHSSFIGNVYTDGGNGGGAYIDISDPGSKVDVMNSSFEANQAGSGGGIYFSANGKTPNTNIRVANSTFGKNIADNGAAIQSYGTLTLLNTTIFQNSTDGGSSGGGIQTSNGTLYLQNAIVAENQGGLSYGNDVSLYSGKIVSYGNNVISDSTIMESGSAGVWLKSDTAGSPKNPLDPQLDSTLALHGGLTNNYIPLEGSLVIDRGSSKAATTFTLDQRGHARIYSKAADIGAVEYDGPFPFPVVFAGKDSSTCDSTVRLKATPVTTPFKGYWTLLGQKASKFITDTTKATTTAKLLVGANKFVWNVTDGNGLKKDTLTITRNGIPAPIILTSGKEACSDTFTLKILGGDTYKWRLANQQSPDTLKTVTQSSVKVGATTEVYSTVTNYKPGTYKVVLSSLNAGGCKHTDTTSLSYFPGKPFAGNDTTVYADSVKLRATAYYQNKQPIFGTWHVLAGKSVIKDSTLLQPEARKLSIGTNKFQYTVATTCKQKDTVLITYIYVSDTAKAGPDQSLCQDSTQLLATLPIKGATGKWTILTKGTTAVLSNDTLFNAKLRKIPQDTVVLVWSITVLKTQKVSRDTIQIINNLSPVKAVAGTYAVATYDTITLKGNVDGTSPSRWRRLTGTGIFQDSTAHTTKVTNLSQGLNKFLYVFVGTCPRLDTAKVTFQLPVVKTSAGKDSSVCTSFYSLSAQKATTGYTGVWRNVDSTNLVFDDSTLNTAKVSGLVQGKNRMVWLIKKGKFVVGSDTVVITQLKIPVAHVIGAFKDNKTYIRTCNSSTTIQATPVGTGETGRWTSLNQVTIANPLQPTSTVTGLHPLDSTTGADKFVWTVTNGICPARDTLYVYYAIVVYTRSDTSSKTVAGHPDTVFVTSNDIYSLGDNLKVTPINFTLGTNQPITGYKSLGDSAVIFYTNPRVYAENKIFTYRLYATNCSNADTTATGKIIITTNNIPPKDTTLQPIQVLSGNTVNQTYSVALFDNNPNIDSVIVLPNPRQKGKIKVTLSPDLTSIILVADYSSNPNFEGLDTVRFRVFDKGINGKIDSADEAVIVVVNKVESNTDVVVYNGLSPNGDGKNDVIEMKNIEFHSKNTFKVFNRWGDKVYEANDYDGKVKVFDGKDLPDGTYYYVLEFEDGAKRQEGFILLKR